MATVFDAAKYILSKTGTISTMKLQKLLYYSQAWALVWDEAPLFEEDFEAWANGPVCVELYDLYKDNFCIDESFLSNADIGKLSENEKETIDIVLKDYGEKDSQWLSNLTHMEAPWRNARIGIPAGERNNKIISKTDIYDYYCGIYTQALIGSEV